MVCAPEMLENYYRSTNALMPLAADVTRLLTARFPACVAGKMRVSVIVVETFQLVHVSVTL